MKKILLALSVLFACSLKANALQHVNAQAVKETVPYQTFCSSVTLSSQTATEITGNNSTIASGAAVYHLKLFDLSTATGVFVSQSSSVTKLSGGNVGAPIGPAPSSGQNLPVDFLLPPYESFYAIADSAGANSPDAPVLVVCKRQ